MNFNEDIENTVWLNVSAFCSLKGMQLNSGFRLDCHILAIILSGSVVFLSY